MYGTNSVLPVRIEPAVLRPQAYRVLSRKHGLSIKTDGLQALAEQVGTQFGASWRSSGACLKFLEEFALIWKQQERGLFVDHDGVVAVSTELKERARNAHAHVSQPTKEQAASEALHIKTLDRYFGAAPVNSKHTPPEEESESVDLEAGSSLSSPPTSGEDQLNWKDYFKVINAFDQQKFAYDPNKMQFGFVAPPVRSEGTLILGPTLKDKISYMMARYYLTKERIMRNANFVSDESLNPLSSIFALNQQITSGFNSDIAKSGSRITPIKNLLGKDGQNFILLGLLRKNQKGSWSLEDPSGIIEVDISQTIPTEGLFFVPGFILLAEGIYYTVGNKFHITSITHPPAEKRNSTLDSIGNLDLLGIHGQSNTNYISKLDDELKVRLHFLERELDEHRFVVLGADIHLDNLITLEGLRTTLKVLNENPPTVLIFPGSFTSVHISPSQNDSETSSIDSYCDGFDSLAQILSDFENLINDTTFIFIPGYLDPWQGASNVSLPPVLPVKPISGSFTKKLNKICKSIFWASNPCRIAYLSQEIVVVREDYTRYLKLNDIDFPILQQQDFDMKIEQLGEDLEQSTLETSVSKGIIDIKKRLPDSIAQSRKLVRTILDQGHLSPFDENVKPILWNLDHTLTLYPIPSTLIICDTTSPFFDVTYNGCKTVNTGTLRRKRKVNYFEYLPSVKRAIEQQQRF